MGPATAPGPGYPGGDPTSGGGGGVTTFKVRCDATHRLADDPIVKPGQPGASHLHQFLGNSSTNASSTADTLLAGNTNCDVPSDKSSYWVPALYVNGQEIVPKDVQVYYRGGGHKDRTAIRAIPNGMRMVIGNAKSTTPQPVDVVNWSCGAEGPDLASPPNCSSGLPLWSQIRFPDCWDGVNLDSTDHYSHLAYTTRGLCPSSHPVQIPLVEVNVSYGNVDGTKATLASGSALSYHGDVFTAWRPGVLDAVVRDCLHTGQVLCAVAGR
jgi:hypothetical protein